MSKFQAIGTAVQASDGKFYGREEIDALAAELAEAKAALVGAIKATGALRSELALADRSDDVMLKIYDGVVAERDGYKGVVDHCTRDRDYWQEQASALRAALDKIIAQEPGKFWNSTRWGEAMQKIAREALRDTNDMKTKSP